MCNGSEYKGDSFPLKAHGGPLLNPSTEDPAQHLSFEYDPKTRLASVRGRTTRLDEAASASEEYSAFANLLRDALLAGRVLSSAPLKS